MDKIHLIMPMGGNGSRFSKCGFDLPKPLIPIYGRPFLFWATNSILKFNEVIDLTFIVLKEHIENYHIDLEIKKFYPFAKIVILNHVLNGPVLTCLEGIKDINDDAPILFNDCDHLFKSTEFNDAIKKCEISKVDGGLITFKSDLPQYSYIMYKDKQIVGTIEKKVVSDDAICGAYLFKSSSQFKKLANLYLSNCKYNEFFLSGMYNEMATLGGKIRIFSTDYHVPFGIPEEYNIALDDDSYIELL